MNKNGVSEMLHRSVSFSDFDGIQQVTELVWLTGVSFKRFHLYAFFSTETTYLPYSLDNGKTLSFMLVQTCGIHTLQLLM